MELQDYIRKIVRECLNENLQSGLLSKEQMIKLGASGSLDKAFERYIPIDKIVGLDPSPKDWTDNYGNIRKYTRGDKINSSIEVIYDSNDDLYYLQNGNHRIKQAKLNGDQFIRAFIQPDKGRIGKDARIFVEGVNSLNQSISESYDDVSTKNGSPVHFHGVTLYHGTNSKFKDFDIEKTGTVQYSDWGKGIYFTRSREAAHHYRIYAVKKLNKEYNDAYDDYINSEKKLKNLKYGSPEYEKQSNLLYVKLKNFQNIGQKLNSTKEGRLIMAKINPNAKIYRFNSTDGLTDPFLAKEAQNKGYDIILIDENRFTEEFVVINPNSITIIGEIKDS